MSALPRRIHVPTGVNFLESELKEQIVIVLSIMKGQRIELFTVIHTHFITHITVQIYDQNLCIYSLFSSHYLKFMVDMIFLILFPPSRDSSDFCLISHSYGGKNYNIIELNIILTFLLFMKEFFLPVLAFSFSNCWKFSLSSSSRSRASLSFWL